MNSVELIGLGALNIDNIYGVERLLEDGEAVVKATGSFPGGSAANTVYGLARLGIGTGFVGAVGEDIEGKELLGSFQDAGVDTGHIRVKPWEKTGQTLCFSDGLGKRSIYVIPGANSLVTAGDIEPAYINQAKMLHMSSFADEGQFQLLLGLMDTLDTAVDISFSPGEIYATRGLTALAPILERTRVLFVNKKEIQRLAAADFETGAENCLGLGCEVVVVTLGGRSEGETPDRERAGATSYISEAAGGYYIKTKGENKPPAVDTTGAGDAFAVGFLYGLLKGKATRQCGLLGDITARFSLTKWGARGGLPSAAELGRRYHELYGQQL
jgi:ribokinase